MRFGNVIMDAKSEEAKALIGKKVIGCKCFYIINEMPNRFTPCILKKINYRDNSPFLVAYLDDDGWEDWYEDYTFIREVVDD